LTYFQDKSLTLDLLYKSDGSWENCFTLNAPEHNIKVPDVTYLGFSGETGEVTDYQDIISVNCKNLYTMSTDSGRNSRGTTSGRSRRAKNSSAGWGWFFFKVFLLCGVVGGGYVGWTIYRTNKRSSRF
jgi:lectin, mannose-binding 2